MSPGRPSPSTLSGGGWQASCLLDSTRMPAALPGLLSFLPASGGSLVHPQWGSMDSKVHACTHFCFQQPYVKVSLSSEYPVTAVQGVLSELVNALGRGFNNPSCHGGSAKGLSAFQGLWVLVMPSLDLILSSQKVLPGVSPQITRYDKNVSDWASMFPVHSSTLRSRN